MNASQARHDKRSPLRQRGDTGAAVTSEELFFDLVYVFAVTQLSHTLLHHLTPVGAFQTLILWFAVWLGWQYTAWATNWFDPETPQIRSLLFAMMLLALVMAAALPDAFGARGLIFALSFAAIQVGRTVFLLFYLQRGTALRANYIRILIWTSLGALFWIVGAFTNGYWRMALWVVAVCCDYISPMIGFRLPILGRSETHDWTIEGGHLAERCQLFVIVALGETVLASGAGFAEAERWSLPVVAGMLVTFLASLAMWWLYFCAGSKEAQAKITASDDPGRLGAYFHYVHVILVGGIIVTAVGGDLIAAHPLAHADRTALIAVLAGPALYFLGSALYMRIVTGTVPLSYLAGIAGLAVLGFVGQTASLLAIGASGVAIMFAAALWENFAPGGRAARQRS